MRARLLQRPAVLACLVAWVTLGAIVIVIMLQTLTASFTLAFSILAGRDQFSFLPVRDYTYFIERVRTLSTRITGLGMPTAWSDESKRRVAA